MALILGTVADLKPTTLLANELLVRYFQGFYQDC